MEAIEVRAITVTDNEMSIKTFLVEFFKAVKARFSISIKCSNYLSYLMRIC